MAPPPEETLIFDGECGFCTACVDWFRARSRKTVRVVPMQRINPEHFGLTLAQMEKEAWWISGAQNYAGHRAVSRALMACGAPWNIVGFVLDVIPFRWGAAIAYRWVARNRGRLPGVLPACQRNERERSD
ncbi:MAG: DUF393 domain-containing protein [Myxococcales bacterium]|nr:DUF393 domain-containing protein [Myxococcales bacterium]